MFTHNNQLIDLVGRVFANGQGDLGSIPGHEIPKTLKMLLDISLLNTQQYKVRIQGKVEQSKERSSYWKRSLLVALDYGHQLTIWFQIFLSNTNNSSNFMISSNNSNLIIILCLHRYMFSSIPKQY